MGLLSSAYLRSIVLLRDQVPGFDRYPFSIAAVKQLHELELHPSVSFLVGENGSGKSTLIEAIAVAAGFNAEGGSKNFRFSTRSSESELYRYLRLVRGIQRPSDGFFLRAESLFNVGSEIERLDAEPSSAPPILPSFGGVSLHEQSHGESFLALVQHRFRGRGLYILDEPEAALSPARQLALLRLIDRLARLERSQFVIATHSPILMAYPHARIFQLGPEGIAPIAYEETEHFQVTRDFLASPERFFKHLFADDE